MTDILVAYVVLDPSMRIKSLKSRITQSVTDKFGADPAKAIRFSFKKSLTKVRAAALIDPKGWNISLSSTESLPQLANEMLAAPYAKKFSLNKEDTAFLDFITCMRNFLSHRSDASWKALKAAISQATGANAFLVDSLHDVGMYLKKADISKVTRAELIVRRLIQIVDQL